ncbi:MAG: ComEC family competence protein [Alphaproteobacteria bacterium]|nr:ComEC family competence protein [Alphaproteobacteria bacterium]
MQKIQEFITTELNSQKNHLFLWCPFFFAGGIAIYFGLKVEPSWFFPLFISVSGALGIGFIYKHQDRNLVFKCMLYALVSLFLVGCGVSVAKFKTQQAYTPMIVKKISPVTVEGVIESIEPQEEKGGSRIILRDVRVEKLKPEGTPRKVRLKVRKDQDIQTGDHVRVLAGLNPASGPVAPGAFDFQRMAYFQGLGAVGFAYNAPEIISRNEGGQSLSLGVLRATISDTIEEKTKAPFRAVITALMTGQRGGIADQDWDALRGSGLAHLLAISGLHVGMVAGVVFFFSRAFLALFPALALKYPIKKWAAVAALIAAAFYTLIVGGTIPTQRALLMTGIVMLAIMLDRSPFSLRLVAFAGFVVLLFSPESLTSVSFQMSFAAVTALICFYEWLRPVWSRAHSRAGILRKAGLYVVGVMLTTIIAGVATGLFSLFHFQNFALYGVLANLVAVPIMSFIVMPLIVLSYLLMPLGLSSLTLPLVQGGVEWILATAHWVNNMEGAVLHVPAWPHWIFILMVVSSWSFIVWQGRFRLIMIAIFMILVLLAGLSKRSDMLLSSDLSLMALKGQKGKLWLSSGNKDRYAADNWLRLNGEAGEKQKRIWPREGGAKGFPFTCDSLGCRGVMKGYQVSVAHSPAAALEDCQWADILISAQPVSKRECQSTQFIDRFDVWREGPHAIWFRDSGIKVKSVEQVRGTRPWTQTVAKNRQEQ